ncbi:MAG: DUF805 domain-containing protein [Bacteroidaceae bacterium]|nr:DUF805 domain-containing protein [Bacteroidaceae bacterium]
MKSRKMFAAPLSFDGRIGRLEYFLTLLIVFAVILVFIYKPYHFINDDVYNFINIIGHPLLTLIFWLLVAQTIKRSHDFELSSVPLKIIPLLLLEGDKKEDENSNENEAGTIQNTYVRFYLCLMLLYACGVTTYLIQWVKILSYNDLTSLALMTLQTTFNIIYFVGFLLLLHYRKVGFYLVTCGGVFTIVNMIGYINAFPELFHYLPIVTIYNIIIYLLYIASFTILYKMLKKASEWEKLEKGLKGTNWKSVLTYFLVLELARYVADSFFQFLNKL